MESLSHSFHLQCDTCESELDVSVTGQHCHFGEDKSFEVGLDLIKDFSIAVPESKALVISMNSGAKKGALDFCVDRARLS